jgi:hypothetical protein
MSEAPAQIRRWTRVQYDRLIEAGIFQTGDKVELLGGQICVSEPQNSPHATAICLAEEALRQAFAGSWSIRVQMPIALATAGLIAPSRGFMPISPSHRWPRPPPASPSPISCHE